MSTMREHANFNDPASAIQAETWDRLLYLLEERYPGKVRRVVEVCPASVVKHIDNQADANETIRRLEDAQTRDPIVPLATRRTEPKEPKA